VKDVSCAVTSKEQVTIPLEIRRRLGLARGSRVCFELVGDHVELRPLQPERPIPAGGFGLLRSNWAPVPADFDPASLLAP